MAKFKIKRGQFIRREGEAKAFKTYNTGDTVEMSDAEAKAFGLGRLVTGGGVEMPSKGDVDKAEASRVAEADHGRTAGGHGGATSGHREGRHSGGGGGKNK